MKQRLPRDVVIDAASCVARSASIECHEYFPVLRLLGLNDLSRVGRPDFSHVTVVAELRDPLCRQRNDGAFVQRADRTFLSLPVFARWHSRDGFDAEQMRLESLQFERSTPRRTFDYSKPQFFRAFGKRRQ